MATWSENKAEIARQIALFPATFEMVSERGATFRISADSGYVNDNGEVQLYTEVLRNGVWLSYAKGTLAELEAVALVGPCTTVKTARIAARTEARLAAKRDADAEHESNMMDIQISTPDVFLDNVHAYMVSIAEDRPMTPMILAFDLIEAAQKDVEHNTNEVERVMYMHECTQYR